jgi:hypothetical protein
MQPDSGVSVALNVLIVIQVRLSKVDVSDVYITQFSDVRSGIHVLNDQTNLHTFCTRIIVSGKRGDCILLLTARHSVCGGKYSIFYLHGLAPHRPPFAREL